MRGAPPNAAFLVVVLLVVARPRGSVGFNGFRYSALRLILMFALGVGRVRVVGLCMRRTKARSTIHRRVLGRCLACRCVWRVAYDTIALVVHCA